MALIFESSCELQDMLNDLHSTRRALLLRRTMDKGLAVISGAPYGILLSAQ